MTKLLAAYIGAGLVVVTLWFTLIYAPFTVQREELKNRSASSVATLDDYDQTMEELPRFLQQANNLRAFRDELNSKLYAKSDILKLFERIATDAIDYDLTLVEITPPIEELLELNPTAGNNDEPQFLNVTLNLRGQFVDFGKYLNHLESAPYFRQVSACYVRGKKLLQPDLDMSITFRALIGQMPEGV